MDNNTLIKRYIDNLIFLKVSYLDIKIATLFTILLFLTVSVHSQIICDSSCLTCSSFNVCLTCAANRVGPNQQGQCTCLRAPGDPQSIWCTSCEVSFPTIKFSNDLSKLLITFNYNIMINSANPFDLLSENCRILFTNSTIQKLGEDPQCQLNLNYKQIIVSLGENPTIDINEAIQLKNYSIREFGCQQYMSQFINAQVTKNENVLQPQVLLNISVNQQVPICNNFTIASIQTFNDGRRGLIYGGWYLDSLHPENSELYTKLTQYLQTVGNVSHLTITAQYLYQDIIYNLHTSVANFLNTTLFNNISFTFQTQSYFFPLILIIQPLKYHLEPWDDNYFVFKIESGRCIKDQQETIIGSSPYQEQFEGSYQIKDAITEEIIYTQIFSYALAINNKTITIPGGTLLENTDYQLLLFSNNIQYNLENLYQVNFQTGFDPLFCFISGGDYIYNYYTQITLQASVLDLSSSQLSTQQQYEWVCIDLVTANICQNLQFTYTSSITLTQQSLLPNHTALIILKVTKNFKSNFYTTNLIPVDVSLPKKKIYLHNEPYKGYYINQHEKVTMQLINKPLTINAALFLSNYQIKHEIIIFEDYFSFRFIDIDIDYSNGQDVIIYLLGVSTTQRYTVGLGPKNCIFTTNKATLENLNDELTLSINNCKSNIANEILTYQYFYYLQKNIYDYDLLNNQFVNGIVLSTKIQNNSNLTINLPDAIESNNKIILVCLINDINGATTQLKKEITVTRTLDSNYTSSQSKVKLFINSIKQITNLKQQILKFYSALQELDNYQNLNCIVQSCSLNGFCTVKGVCQCSIGSYFSDCSGSEVNEKQNYQNFLISNYNLTLAILQQVNLTKNQSQLNSSNNSNQIEEIYYQKTDQLLIFLIKDKYFSSILPQIDENQIFYIMSQLQITLSKKFQKFQQFNTQFQDIITNFQTLGNQGMVSVPSQEDTYNIQDIYPIIQNAESIFKSISFLYDKIDINLDKVLPPEYEKFNKLLQKVQALIDKFINITLISMYYSQNFQQFTYYGSAILIESQFSDLETAINKTTFQSLDIRKMIEDSSIQGANTARQRVLRNRKILKSNVNNNHILASDDEESDIQLVTINFKVYLFNPYLFNEKFPYRKSIYPVVDMGLYYSNEGTNNNQLITLSNVTKNKFNILFNATYFEYNSFLASQANLNVDNKNYICLIRQESDQNWVMDGCTTQSNQLTFKNSLGEWKTTYSILCMCDHFGNITLIDDYDHKYISDPVVVLIPREVIFIFVAVIGFFWLILMIWGAIQDSEDNQKNYQKKGKSTLNQKQQQNQVNQQQLITDQKKQQLEQEQQLQQAKLNQLHPQEVKQNNLASRSFRNGQRKSLTASKINQDIRDTQSTKAKTSQQVQNNNKQDDIQEIKLESNNVDGNQNTDNQLKENKEQQEIEEKQLKQVDLNNLDKLKAPQKAPQNQEKTFCNQYKYYHSLTSIFVIYMQYKPRPLRVLAYFSRYYYNLVIAGYFARQEVDYLWGSIYICVVSCFSRGLLGMILRVVEKVAQHLNQKGNPCWWVSYYVGLGIIFGILGYFVIIFFQLLIDIPEYNIQYWGLLYIIVFILDSFVFELIVMYFDYSCQPPMKEKKVDIPINVYNNDQQQVNQPDLNTLNKNQKRKVQPLVQQQIQYIEITLNTETAPINENPSTSPNNKPDNKPDKLKQLQQPQSSHHHHHSKHKHKQATPSENQKPKTTPAQDWEKSTATPISLNEKRSDDQSQF